MARSVTVEREVVAPSQVVWDLVSDVTRMGEWSPETSRCTWLDGAIGPAVGARFRGRNAHRGRRWFTTCTVERCEPGHAFGFAVRAGPIPVAAWEYRFEDTPAGCCVTETFTDRRAGVVALIGDALLNIRDRGEHNRATMTETLRRLAAAAESSFGA